MTTAPAPANPLAFLSGINLASIEAEFRKAEMFLPMLIKLLPPNIQTDLAATGSFMIELGTVLGGTAPSGGTVTPPAA